jgi:hypothetical protein
MENGEERKDLTDLFVDERITLKRDIQDPNE